MKNLSQYLFLASGVKNGEGFWCVGVKNFDENIFDDKDLLDCHRKELIGEESAKDILFAINLNLNNLIDKLDKNGFLIDRPSKGISFNIPLDVLEDIFDFWLNIYKQNDAWETCLGLLKVKKRVSLTDLVKCGYLKGNSKIWAMKVDHLHSYIPNSKKQNSKIEPMWN